MGRILIYTVSIPEMVMQNQTDPPILTGKHFSVPVVNCPRLDRGDRTVLEVCDICESKKEILAHFVDCNYVLSQQEKDEWDRRRKGVGVVKQATPPPPTAPVPNKDPGQPKNVFTKK